MVKISQFEFLVLTEKNIFVYKLFLSLKNSYLRFKFILFVKIATLPPSWKNLVTPLISSNPFLKLRVCQAPLFETFLGWGGLNLPFLKICLEFGRKGVRMHTILQLAVVGNLDYKSKGQHYCKMGWLGRHWLDKLGVTILF